MIKPPPKVVVPPPVVEKPEVIIKQPQRIKPPPKVIVPPPVIENPEVIVKQPQRIKPPPKVIVPPPIIEKQDIIVQQPKRIKPPPKIIVPPPVYDQPDVYYQEPQVIKPPPQIISQVFYEQPEILVQQPEILLQQPVNPGEEFRLYTIFTDEKTTSTTPNESAFSKFLYNRYSFFETASQVGFESDYYLNKKITDDDLNNLATPSPDNFKIPTIILVDWTAYEKVTPEKAGITQVMFDVPGDTPTTRAELLYDCWNCKNDFTSKK